MLNAVEIQENPSRKTDKNNLEKVWLNESLTKWESTISWSSCEAYVQSILDCDVKSRFSMCWFCWDDPQELANRSINQRLIFNLWGVTILTLAVKCTALCSLLTEHLECINSSRDSSSVWRAPLSSITLTMTQTWDKYMKGAYCFILSGPGIPACSFSALGCLLKPPEKGGL